MTESRRWMGAVLCLVLAGSALAGAPTHRHGEAGDAWTEQPRLVKARGFSRSVALLRPVGLRADGATVLPSVEPGEPSARHQVPLRDDKFAVRTLGSRQGGYYRVAAMASKGARLRIASTILYFSNPGPAPRAMLAESAMPLEIVPLALPREHRHYRADETWDFELRAQGRPLADHPVSFETAQGTRLSLRSDADGRIRIDFPDDFPAAEPGDGHQGHRRGPRSDFVLSASWRDADGRELSTAFNYDYRPGAYVGKDIWLGGGFALLGMLAATPLLRRRERRGTAR